MCRTSKSFKDVLVILAYGETWFHQKVSKQYFLAILPGRGLKLFDLPMSHSISQYFTAPLTTHITHAVVCCRSLFCGMLCHFVAVFKNNLLGKPYPYICGKVEVGNSVSALKMNLLSCWRSGFSHELWNGLPIWASGSWTADRGWGHSGIWGVWKSSTPASAMISLDTLQTLQSNLYSYVAVIPGVSRRKNVASRNNFWSDHV